MPQHDRKETLLTIAELADILALPESTARYYCHRFSAHLPFAGDGRRRRYLPEALDILRFIAESMRSKKNAFAVDLALRERKELSRVGTRREPEKDAPGTPLLAGQAPGILPGQTMSLMERQTQALQQIAGAMTVFAERLAAASEQAVPVVSEASPPMPGTQTETEGSEAMRNEIAALRKQIRAAEAVHQNDLEQLRKWLTRLGESMSKDKD